ncbi:MAG: hypothetical protein HYV35_02660 [Lentisphaerae bacterium]|nr:hypothetical protein [Lentisphaerota bacterium]
MLAQEKGKVITAGGLLESAELGRVMMHEHLYCDIYDWAAQRLITEEQPITPERRELLMTAAVPPLKECNQHGCHALVDATPAPWRAWPTFYQEISRAANMHIILCTGFYREVELSSYWAKTPATQIWPFVREATVEQLAEFCEREIMEGLCGTAVRAGAIKLGSSQSVMTAAEEKAFRAGARAQKATGVHITTHCTRLGAETSQLELFDREGVDLSRVVIGHTAWHLTDANCRKVCLGWMKRGANFLPTNLGISEDGGKAWQPLVDAIHAVFDAGLGSCLVLGLDWAFTSESGPFAPCGFVPPPPFLHLFTHTLPAFRAMGLTSSEEEIMMQVNPQRILPVQ